MEFTGGCHCGAVRYRCDAEPLRAGHCQCADCRRLSGTGHISSLAVPADRVYWTGEPRAYTHQTDSGNPLTRTFCPTCGAPLYSASIREPSLINLRASSLDDPTVFQPTSVAWAGSAADWDVMAPELTRYPGNRPPLR